MPKSNPLKIFTLLSAHTANKTQPAVPAFPASPEQSPGSKVWALDRPHHWELYSTEGLHDSLDLFQGGMHFPSTLPFYFTVQCPRNESGSYRTFQNYLSEPYQSHSQLSDAIQVSTLKHISRSSKCQIEEKNVLLLLFFFFLFSFSLQDETKFWKTPLFLSKQNADFIKTTQTSSCINQSRSNTILNYNTTPTHKKLPCLSSSYLPVQRQQQ